MTEPYLLLQSDWQDALNEDGGNAWICCKNPTAPSQHGKISKRQNEILASEGFRIGQISKDSIEILHSEPNLSCKFIAPQVSFNGIHLKSVISMDVTPNGLGVSVSCDNKMLIWESQTGIERRSLEGHLGDIYTCRFFPSGLVVLSAGADMQLKIWSAETGECPVSLKGHTRAILDTAIVDRGRNVISVGKDGTARLWDCGQSTCIATLCQVEGEINGCALNIASNSLDLGNPVLPKNEREIGTEGKLLLLACEDKTVRGVGVQSRSQVMRFDFSAAVNCCAFLSEAEFVCGCEDGYMHQMDVRNTRKPLYSWVDSNVSVLTLLPFRNGFFAGKHDGMCSFYSPNASSKYQLSGPDCDPVFKIVADGKNLFTCSRDGSIRRYCIQSV